MSMFIEVAFKGDRREIFSNPQGIELHLGDYVVVQVEKGEDLGKAACKGVVPDDSSPRSSFPPILRLATEEELKRIPLLRSREAEALAVCRGRIAALDMPMKLVDIEVQFDGSKMCLYFTAERRVDFRGLVRDLGKPALAPGRKTRPSRVT